jgi:hypothetical protein
MSTEFTRSCPSCRQPADRLTMSGVCDECAEDHRREAFDDYLSECGALFDEVDE